MKNTLKKILVFGLFTFLLMGPIKALATDTSPNNTKYEGETLCSSSDQEANDQAFLSAYAKAHTEDSQRAEQDCIVDAETANHYCEISSRPDVCRKENALRLKEPLICNNYQPCIAEIAIHYEDLQICEQSERKAECYKYFGMYGSREGLDYSLLYQACKNIIEIENNSTPPSSGPYPYSPAGNEAFSCITNIIKNKDDMSICDEFDREKIKNLCVLKVKTAISEKRNAEETANFAEKVKNREAGFYYAYIIYGLLTLIFGVLYWKFKNLRPVMAFNLIILALIAIFGSSIKLGIYTSWQHLVEATRSAGWHFRDPTAVLWNHSNLHGVWPWWLVVAYFNLSDLIFALIPSVLISATGQKKWGLAINIILYLLINGFYILLSAAQSLSG